MNPGNPYIGSKTQNGFCTFGPPDYAASQGEAAARSLDRVWYQKWLIHLTHRPESGGGVLQQILSGNQSKIDARLNKNVLNSQAVAQSFAKYGTYLLSQAFPRGVADASVVSYRSRNRGRRMHYLYEVFFRRNFRDPESTGAIERWPIARALQRFGRRPDHRQWRTEQARAQRQLRSRCPSRNPLALGYRLGL